MISASNLNVLSSEHEVPQSQIQKYFEFPSLNMGPTLTSTRQNDLTPLNFSSSLEPIFKTEEEQDNVNYIQEGITVAQINQNHMDTEVDISMDEFLKFKDTTYANLVSRTTREVEARPHEINYPTATVEQAAASALPPDFPQMSAAVKMEITEQEDNQENEANFRNFFSQYRASLNLLYERH